MGNRFTVSVLEFEELREIPGVRTPENLGSLLDAMEFGERSGLGAGDLREMCLMSLQDRGARDAAATVLTHDLSDRLTTGQISNMAGDMLDEKLWEHYADMSLHERLFHVGSLLWSALPDSFPEPDAVRVRLEIRAGNDAAAEVLEQPLHESLLVRLLADGMSDRSVLHRLFDAQLAGRSFPEADSVVWIVDAAIVDARTQVVSVTSSGQWLDALRDARTYGSAAYADA